VGQRGLERRGSVQKKRSLGLRVQDLGILYNWLFSDTWGGCLNVFRLGFHKRRTPLFYPFYAELMQIQRKFKLLHKMIEVLTAIRNDEAIGYVLTYELLFEYSIVL